MNKDLERCFHILFYPILLTVVLIQSTIACDSIRVNLYIDSSIVHVKAFIEKQSLDSAIYILNISLENVEKEKCTNSFKVNELYQNLGYAHQLKLNFSQAEFYYSKAVELLKTFFKTNEISIAKCQNLLGNLYVEMGQYHIADSLYHEVKSIYDKVLEKDHLWHGWILHNLGRLKIYQGRLSESLVELTEALRIKIINVGDNHVDAAGTMVYLAYIYEQLGDLKTAEYFSTVSSNIWIKHYGEGSVYHAYAAHNLININLRLGNYNEADELANKAIELKVKHFGSNHTSLATTYNAKGNIYQVQQNYNSAIESYRKAEQIFLFLGDTSSAEYVFVIHNLGVCYMGIKQLESAKFYLNKALHLKYLLNGTDNMDYVSTLIHVAELLILQNKFNEAEGHMLPAKKYMEDNRIVINDNYLLLLSLFEKKAMHENNISEALQWLEQELSIIKQQLDHLSLIGAENEMLLFIEKSETYVNRYLSFCINNMPDEEWETSFFENILFFKHYLLTDYQALRNFAQADVDHRDDFLKYFYLNQEILQTQLQVNMDISKYDSLISERRLIERATLHRMNKDISKIDKIRWQDLQKNLKKGEAILEFISYADKKDGEGILQNNYAAIILKIEDTKPKVISLPDLRKLDSFLFLKNQNNVELIFELYSSEPLSLLNVGHERYNLYQIVFNPLKYFLKDIKTIYYSTSGLLHQINLNAIALNDTTFFGEEFELILLGSTKQILNRGKEMINSPSNVLIVGGVNYDAKIGEMGYNDSVFTKGNGTKGIESSKKPALKNQNQYWKNIQYSEEEVEAIKNIFTKSEIKTELIKGKYATESSIKSKGILNESSPEVIHISTHGYFYSKHESMESTPQGKNKMNDSVFKKSSNPLVRSGLIMAGGNKFWNTSGTQSNREDDGILTAFEISQLNLNNTQLVVLSACESGLGYVQGQEGTFGLQRAFKIAGVKNIIVSLWNIPDFHTKELMALFYRNWIIKKMTVRKSLKMAQENMKSQGFEPYYWAGFVLVE